MGCNEPQEKYPKPKGKNPYNLPGGGYPDYEFAPGDQVVPIHEAMDFIVGRIDMMELVTRMMIVVDYDFAKMYGDTRIWIVDDPMKFMSNGKHFRSSWAGHQLAPIIDKDGSDLFTSWKDWQAEFFNRRKPGKRIFQDNGRPL